jgi:hypothetical protein
VHDALGPFPVYGAITRDRGLESRSLQRVSTVRVKLPTPWAMSTPSSSSTRNKLDKVPKIGAEIAPPPFRRQDA